VAGLLLPHIDTMTVLFGLLAVGSFWVAIQLCWAARGRTWTGVALRVLGAVALIGFGVLMVFYTAFGASSN
jgi:hypothetical protein